MSTRGREDRFRAATGLATRSRSVRDGILRARTREDRLGSATGLVTRSRSVRDGREGRAEGVNGGTMRAEVVVGMIVGMLDVAMAVTSSAEGG